MKLDYILRISVHRATLLPQKVATNKTKIRVSAVIELENDQGKLEPRRQETDNGLWSSKSRSKDLIWNTKRQLPMAVESAEESGGIPNVAPNSNGVLQWILTESELRYLKTFHPKIRIYCYSTKFSKDDVVPGRTSISSLAQTEPLGWMQLDIRDLQAHRITNESFPLKSVKGETNNIRLDISAFLECDMMNQSTPKAPLRSSLGPIEIDASLDHAHIIGAGGRSDGSPRSSSSSVRERWRLNSSVSSDKEEALAIGNGMSLFELEVTIEGASDLLCLAPELEGSGLDFWFSFELFGVVLQSECFSSLTLPNIAVTTDAFRLKGSISELTHCFQSFTPLYVYLCSAEMVIACGVLSFPDIEPNGSVLDAVFKSQKSSLLPQRLGVVLNENHAPCFHFSLSVHCDHILDENESHEQVGEELKEEVEKDIGDPFVTASEQPIPLPSAPSPTPQSQAEVAPLPSPQSQTFTEVAPLPPAPSPQSQTFTEVAPLPSAPSPTPQIQAEVAPLPPAPSPTPQCQAFTQAVPPSSSKMREENNPSGSFTVGDGGGGEGGEGGEQLDSITETKLHRMAEALAVDMAESLAENKLNALKQSWLVEWERWQLESERNWNEKLRKKEMMKMKELEEVYATKEKERSALVARSVSDYSKLESKLRTTLLDLESKERKLVASELELKQAHAQKLSELQLLQRRLREDSRHQIELEKQKRKETEEKVALSEDACDRLRRRFSELENDFDSFRKANRRAPEAVIRAELAKVTGEKAEAEGRVEKERAEKNQALLEKEKLRAHVHQLVRALKREQEKASLAAKHEVEQLRVQFLSKEESFVLDGDRRELDIIKNELESLKSISTHRPGSRQPPPSSLGSSSSIHHNQEDSLHRLRRERDNLIATGQYRDGDMVIAQMDECIRQAEIEGHG